ncbi:MAG: sulfotransferase [Thermodesulfobacteriota bacterium]
MGKIKRIRPNKVSLLKARRTSERQARAVDGERLQQIDGLCETGKFADAENLLDRLLVESPASALVLSKLGSVNYKQGRMTEAEAYFRKALKFDKQNISALIGLGRLEGDLGRVDSAAAFYNKTLKISPDNYLALNGMGGLFLKTGNLEMARNVFEKVIRLEPHSSEGLYGLGRVNASQAQFAEAEINYRLAILNRPEYAEAYHSWGIIQAKQGRYAEAEDSYRKSLDIRPDNINAMFDLAELYEKSNRLQESKEIVNRSLDVAPGNLGASRIMATLLRREGKPGEALKWLDSVSLPENNPAKSSEVHYELARIYDRLGENEKAYRHFDLTKKFQGLEPQSRKFNKDNFLQGLLQLKTFFTEERLKRLAAEKLPVSGLQPVFLVGFPRSGTTLMDQVLACHPDFSVAEETAALDMVIHKIKRLGKGYPDALDDLAEETLVELRQEYFSSLKRSMGGDKPTGIVVDKYPLHIIHLGLIAKLFPGAKVILAIRHPYDVCLSNFMQLFRLNDAMANFTNLTDTANCYDQVMSLGLHYMKFLSLQFHQIRYEDLVENFEETAKQLLTFLGADWDETVLKYYEYARAKTNIMTPSYQQVTEPIYKRSVLRFINYASFFTEPTDVLKFYVDRFGYDDVDDVLSATEDNSLNVNI